MATVVLVGTLDTKGREYDYLRERLRGHGVDTLLVDAGVLGERKAKPDVTREEVARAAGADVHALAAADDRGAAVETMSRGAAEIVTRLHGEGRLDGLLALGGSGGTAVATEAMRALPVGVPKLMVSTMASGDTRPYVGASDATMFGVTTPCVTTAREHLEELGYEVLVFHATGTGGQSMEALMRSGFITASLDITTTELADDLVGGVLSAGPDRLEAACELGLPQVVSVGALDMVNFGPIDRVPPQFRSRNLYKHNPTVTLMRTTPAECAELGRRIARKLNAARGPVTLFIPLRGVSLIDTEGQVFWDPEADRALFDALRETIDPGVDVRELDTDVNDPAFARAMADTLHEHHEAWAAARAG